MASSFKEEGENGVLWYTKSPPRKEGISRHLSIFLVQKAEPNFSGSLVLLFRGNEVVDDSRTQSLPLKLTPWLLKVLYAPYGYNVEDTRI